MSVARIEELNNVEEVKSVLRDRFEDSMSRVPLNVLLKAVKMDNKRAFAAVAQAELEPHSDKKKSIETRMQAAVAKMREAAFERVKSRCELLDAADVCELLDIKKQSISQKTKLGQILAYTKQRRKFYPSFQIVNNKVHPAIKRLISELNLDPEDLESMNLLVQHLIGKMDYSEPGEPSNEVPRYSLLSDEAALEIIKRDFINSTEMGQ